MLTNAVTPRIVQINYYNIQISLKSKFKVLLVKKHTCWILILMTPALTGSSEFLLICLSGNPFAFNFLSKHSYFNQMSLNTHWPLSLITKPTRHLSLQLPWLACLFVDYTLKQLNLQHLLIILFFKKRFWLCLHSRQLNPNPFIFHRSPILIFSVPPKNWSVPLSFGILNQVQSICIQNIQKLTNFHKKLVYFYILCTILCIIL